MANIPIIGKVTVGGTAKNISGGYVNIGGVWKPIVKTYVNVNGVWKFAWRNLTTWKKYTVERSEGAPYTAVRSSNTSSITLNAPTGVYAANAYTFDTTTGIFKISTTGTSFAGTLSESQKYFRVSSVSGEDMYEFASKTSAGGSMYNFIHYVWSAQATVTQTIGAYVSDVTSENVSAYPDNGIHTDGYWYVKQ